MGRRRNRKVQPSVPAPAPSTSKRPSDAETKKKLKDLEKEVTDLCCHRQPEDEKSFTQFGSFRASDFVHGNLSKSVGDLKRIGLLISQVKYHKKSAELKRGPDEAHEQDSRIFQFKVDPTSVSTDEPFESDTNKGVIKKVLQTVCCHILKIWPETNIVPSHDEIVQLTSIGKWLAKLFGSHVPPVETNYSLTFKVTPMYNDKKEYVQRDFDCIDNAGFIPLAEYFSLEARDAHAIHLVFYCYACKFFRAHIKSLLLDTFQSPMDNISNELLITASNRLEHALRQSVPDQDDNVYKACLECFGPFSKSKKDHVKQQLTLCELFVAYDIGFVAKRSVISLTLKDVEEELRFNGGGTYKPTAYRVFQGSTVAIMPAFLSDTPLKSFDEQCHVEGPALIFEDCRDIVPYNESRFSPNPAHSSPKPPYSLMHNVPSESIFSDILKKLDQAIIDSPHDLNVFFEALIFDVPGLEKRLETQKITAQLDILEEVFSSSDNYLIVLELLKTVMNQMDIDPCCFPLFNNQNKAFTSLVQVAGSSLGFAVLSDEVVAEALQSSEPTLYDVLVLIEALGCEMEEKDVAMRLFNILQAHHELFSLVFPKLYGTTTCLPLLSLVAQHWPEMVPFVHKFRPQSRHHINNGGDGLFHLATQPMSQTVHRAVVCLTKDASELELTLALNEAGSSKNLAMVNLLLNNGAHTDNYSASVWPEEVLDALQISLKFNPHNFISQLFKNLNQVQMDLLVFATTYISIVLLMNFVNPEELLRNLTVHLRQEGTTLLHVLSQYGDVKLIYGHTWTADDFYATDKNGKTPSQLARNKEVVDCLSHILNSLEGDL